MNYILEVVKFLLKNAFRRCNQIGNRKKDNNAGFFDATLNFC